MWHAIIKWVTIEKQNILLRISFLGFLEVSEQLYCEELLK